jgi:hypothetical protein
VNLDRQIEPILKRIQLAQVIGAPVMFVASVWQIP